MYPILHWLQEIPELHLVLNYNKYISIGFSYISIYHVCIYLIFLLFIYIYYHVIYLYGSLCVAIYIWFYCIYIFNIKHPKIIFGSKWGVS